MTNIFGRSEKGKQTSFFFRPKFQSCPDAGPVVCNFDPKKSGT